jgi:hypothetical protein
MVFLPVKRPTPLLLSFLSAKSSDDLLLKKRMIDAEK